MPRSYRYLHYDVFTDRLFGGNQLAVVLEARGLPGGTLQAIAREMAFSETTFVLPPERSDTDVRMRIFTPGEELPMAGHPTIGATFALARCGVIEQGRSRFTFGLGVGPTPVALAWKNGELSFAWMTQGLPVFGDPIPDPARAAEALSLPGATVTATGYPVQIVSCGVPFLFVPLATRGSVDAAVVNRERLDALMSQTIPAAHGVFLFSTERTGDGAAAYSRMFAPAIGIAEDAATGGASGPLGCYLVQYGIVEAGNAGSMLSLQGVRMGRPSHVYISIGVRESEKGGVAGITDVRVGGQAVLAGEGILYV
jgi:trans-2,3-dihydro-3-hydroxyanthranilate isomerase